MLFKLAKNGNTYTINSDSGKYNPEHLLYFEFIGKIMAKAIYDGMMIDCYFTRIIYKLILGTSISYHDMEDYDPVYYNSIKWLLENDLTNAETYLTYSYNHDNLGEIQTVDLIENGRNVLVTQYNLDEYIDKRIEYFTKSQLSGIREIIRGINTIFPVDYLKIFTSDQLGLLINGTPFIDTEDWRMNTKYKDYQDYDNVIINFWDIISELSQEDLSNFLLFCTGSSRVPIGGFKSLESNRGQISNFEIVKTEYYEGKKNFLRAHTCFNRLDLPNFPNKETLNEAIKFALENEVLGFGIE
jgi:E3 ubiquitin-protein ligase HUWE1